MIAATEWTIDWTIPTISIPNIDPYKHTLDLFICNNIVLFYFEGIALLPRGLSLSVYTIHVSLNYMFALKSVHCVYPRHLTFNSTYSLHFFWAFHQSLLTIIYFFYRFLSGNPLKFIEPDAFKFTYSLTTMLVFFVLIVDNVVTIMFTKRVYCV